jgi:GAF domain-containing protein
MSSAFSTPIIRLHSTAEQIIAGDLEAQAQVESGDEIGNLARAFNNMTARLKTFISELEDRVRERTQELARQNETLIFRSRQLQTVSDVARGIISTREFEALLTQVTTLVSERFNFYHVGVFLNDLQGEYTVLRAANSEGGRKMLTRQHRLKIGEVGIVGYVTLSGEPRIATDVGQDAVFFNNPDLPLTRSEMALPLKANERIIGALDVQSTEPNAFTQEDIELFSTLADQISIAIVNNQLLNETVKALEEAQRIHRQYLRQEWTGEIANRQIRAFAYTTKGTVAQTETELPEIKKAIEIGEPVAKASEGKDQPAILAVPIKLRGETIGVIHIKDAGIPNRKWNDDEITSISAVADQVGLALENARLLEKTIRRSERDRRALEITGKIRSANDPNAMIEIAMQELQKALNASQAVIVMKDNGSDDQTLEPALSSNILKRAIRP